MKARDNFQGKKNKIFDLKQFRQCSIKKVYDSLHGISRDYVELAEIVEIMAYCLIDGKVEQKSVFETRLYNDLLEQLKNDKERFRERPLEILLWYLRYGISFALKFLVSVYNFTKIEKGHT